MSHAPGPHHIRVELEQADATYTRGELVTGRVLIRASHDAQVDLSVELQMVLRGELKRVFVFAEQRQASAPLGHGQELVCPFRFELPPTLLSYAGHCFTLEPRIAAVLWPSPAHPPTGVAALGRMMSVGARSELAARLYPAAARPFHMMPLPTRPRPLRVVVAGETSWRGSGTESVTAGLGLVLVGLALGLVATPFVVGWLAVHLVGAILGGLGGLFIVVGLAAALWNLRKWLDDRAVGRPELSFRASRDREADILDLAVRLRPHLADLRVRATVRALERVTRDMDSANEVREHLLASETVLLPPTGEAGTYRALLDISVPARFPCLPLSLGYGPRDASRVEIVWHLVLTVALPGRREWDRVLPLVVAREGEEAATATVTSLAFD